MIGLLQYYRNVTTSGSPLTGFDEGDHPLALFLIG
jgi:hypothetical protein